MATIRVSLPAPLVRAPDALGGRRKASRNRLVVETCQRLVNENREKRRER